jgi:uncharacterized protein involved in exopolysaccharide biosynthesis
MMLGEEDRTTNLREYPELPLTAARAPEEQSGLREYSLVLWRKRLTVLVVTAICVGLTLAYCVAVKPTYQASATVLLEPAISPTLMQANFPTGTPTLINVPDDIQVLESSAVADIVARTQPNPPSVTAKQVGTTDVLQVSVRSKDPQGAAAAANAYARAYISFEHKQTVDTFTSAESQLASKVNTLELAISNLNSQIRSAPAGVNVTPDETQLGDLESQLATLQDQLQNYQFYASQGVTQEGGQIISAAIVPAKPVSPKTLEWTVLALIFGLILGIGVALLANAVSVKR